MNAGSLALMATVTWELARTALIDRGSVLLAAAAAVGLVLRVDSAWLVVGGVLVGFLLSRVGDAEQRRHRAERRGNCQH